MRTIKETRLEKPVISQLNKYGIENVEMVGDHSEEMAVSVQDLYDQLRESIDEMRGKLPRGEIKRLVNKAIEKHLFCKPEDEFFIIKFDNDKEANFSVMTPKLKSIYRDIINLTKDL